MVRGVFECCKGTKGSQNQEITQNQLPPPRRNDYQNNSITILFGKCPRALTRKSCKSSENNSTEIHLGKSPLLVQGQKKKAKLFVAENSLFGPAFWPKNPPPKFMWVPFCRPFPETEAHKLLSGGRKCVVLGVGGKKAYVEKFMCHFSSPMVRAPFFPGAGKGGSYQTLTIVQLSLFSVRAPGPLTGYSGKSTQDNSKIVRSCQ